MDETETAGDPVETLSDEPLRQYLERRLAHFDHLLHDIDQKIAEMHAIVVEHKPLLEAFTGAGVRSFLSGRKKANGGR